MDEACAMNEMVTLPREVVTQALEALEHIQRCIGFGTATIHYDSATWAQLDAAHDALRAALAAGEARPCTCHPDDNPPQPCARRYALAECRAASEARPELTPAAYRVECRWARNADSTWRKYGDYGTLAAAQSSQQRFAAPGDIEVRIVPLYAGEPMQPQEDKR